MDITPNLCPSLIVYNGGIMTIYRCILPLWAQEENPGLSKVKEGLFDREQIETLNKQGYNIYYLPNHPSLYEGGTVDGFHIDTFNYVFVDMDLKDGIYKDKDEFLKTISEFSVTPNKIIDSGNGMHVYWKVSDLDAKSYLRLQRRLIRQFNTDDAIGQIYQLMRVPNTINTKYKEAFKSCELLYEEDVPYTCEILDKALPILTKEDEEYCNQHHNKTYRLEQKTKNIDEKIPLKFVQLLDKNDEVKDIWAGKTDDRSASDFRLGHIMFANAFTKSEASSVLVNTAKALARAPIHRMSYASNIVDKIWTYEITPDKGILNLSSTVLEILQKSGDSIKGTRFPCWNYLDQTEHGFRLGQVIGLVAGSGVGKTAVALNMFQGFVHSNPDYDHFFIPLEQPSNEIADRWKTMCGDNKALYEKVHVISNYDENGQFRNLSFIEIKDYILKFQQVTGRKIGCIVIDHIGALKKKGKDGENQDLISICHAMKGFAIETNTLLVMQSQAPREKASIGDLELDKDAAYGTMYFEAYCDYLISLWQPLKRCYKEGAPTITAFKFCKIRHKKQGIDKIEEDVNYKLTFDSQTELLRELNENEEKSFTFWLNRATNKRKADRKTDLVEYVSAKWKT